MIKFEVLSKHSRGGNEENHMKLSVRAAALQSETLTRGFLNMKQKWYPVN
jgi:hypothetical protein